MSDKKLRHHTGNIKRKDKREEGEREMSNRGRRESREEGGRGKGKRENRVEVGRGKGKRESREEVGNGEGGRKKWRESREEGKIDKGRSERRRENREEVGSGEGKNEVWMESREEDGNGGRRESNKRRGSRERRRKESHRRSDDKGRSELMEEPAEGEKVRKPRLPKQPHTTIQSYLSNICPSNFNRFLWSEPSEFRISKVFFGFGIGAIFSIGFYFLVVDRLDLYEEHKIYILYGLSSVMGLGWSISAYYRCATLILLPNMLGGEGRGILLLLLITAIMEGPVSNIEKNIEVVSESVGCTVELQINHTKLLWKMMLLPMKNIILNMMDDSKKFGKGTMKVKHSFSEVNNEIISKEGYDMSKEQSDKEGNLSTQKLFEQRTKERCEFIVTNAIRRCKLWYEEKHIACLEKIPIPIFNHLFCVPMVFDFMCNIMKVMNPWCKDRIPVDSNFGQLYDRVNDSVENLNQDFTTEMAVNKVEQESITGANLTRAEITQTVHEELLKKRTLMEKFISVIKLLISLSFFILFISAFLYTYNFNKDIRYDNIYICSYFRQIDARRRVMDRRYLLPLRKAEQCDLISPWQLKFYHEELRTLVMGIALNIPIFLVLIMLFILDWMLFTMLDIIQRHSYLEYNFSESHHLEIEVRGTSILANLIRKTVAAFNSSIDIQTVSNNLHCLPKPHKMKKFSICLTLLPMAGIILFCFLQVYSYRLRRVIAAFCFPKREKKRVLFLYNEWLRKRITYAETQRKKIIMQARTKQLRKLGGFAGTLHRLFPFLQRFIRKRCLVCNEGPTETSYHCPNPGCGAMYCQECWKDVRRFCFNCLPFEGFVSEGSDIENNPTYAS